MSNRSPSGSRQVRRGDLAEQLPPELAPFLATDTEAKPIEIHESLRRVAEREETDVETAERHVRAARLPADLHAPLARGKRRSGGKATRMSLEELVGRVAELEGVDPEKAHDHVRAVLATLREALGDEFRDVYVQLPDEFEAVLTS